MDAVNANPENPVPSADPASAASSQDRAGNGAGPVLRTIDLRGQDLAWAQLRAVVPRQTDGARQDADDAIHDADVAADRLKNEKVREDLVAAWDRMGGTLAGSHAV